MNIAVFDDNQRFAEIFQRKLVERLNISAVTGFCIAYSDIDILLLSDLSFFNALFFCLDLPGLNGIEVAFSIREKYPSLLIVLLSTGTAYAPAGYRLGAFRYLLKQNLEQEFDLCVTEVLAALNTE